MAIDLGTANTLVYVHGRGIVVSEPSVVAIDATSGEVHAVGDEAKRMIGRTPARITATRPLRHGVIADFEVTQEMLRYFLARVRLGRLSYRRVVMCVPSGVTQVEIGAVEEACISAGAHEVHLIEEPIAAAVGAGLDISEAAGRMVVDVGGGTSEVAVISMGGMVVKRSLRTGGYDFDDAIVGLLRRDHGLVIGQPTAEALKLAIGSAGPLEEELTGEVRGRDAVTGLPRRVGLSSEEVRAACEEPLHAICEAVKDSLEQTPPELAADTLNNGILMAGGGSLLRGFTDRIEEETHMPTYLAESPLTCVAEGAGRSLEELHILSRKARRSRAYAVTSPYVRPAIPGSTDGSRRSRRRRRRFRRRRRPRPRQSY
jgi:rod shape-determining protein MreB